MLNSVQHENYPAQNVKMTTIFGILRFIIRKDTLSEIFKATSFNPFQVNGIFHSFQSKQVHFRSKGCWVIF